MECMTSINEGEQTRPSMPTGRPDQSFWLLTLGGFLMMVSPFITINYNPPPCWTGSQCAMPSGAPVWLLPLAILMPLCGASSLFLALKLRTGFSKRRASVGRFSIVVSAVYFVALTIILAEAASSNNALGLAESALTNSIGPLLVIAGGLQLVTEVSTSPKN